MNINEKILIVLDLDETLIYATKKKIDSISHDFIYDDFFVYKRPYLAEFLQSIKDDFRIAVWSSAGDEYVSQIVSNVFPENYKLEFIWGRSKCTLKKDLVFDNYYFTKPLKKIKRNGFNLEQTLIIDDTPEKSKTNYGNAIYIKEFKGEADEELNKLSIYLQSLKKIKNVREVEKRMWHK
jgi:RNA polymerase II subunit A small phosphatase-like protein